MYEIDRVLIAKSKKSKKKILSLIWRLIKGSLFKRSNKKLYKFSGWGMDINHSDPPWETLPTAKDKIFEQINNLLLERISNKEFCLTQFENLWILTPNDLKSPGFRVRGPRVTSATTLFVISAPAALFWYIICPGLKIFVF